MSCTCAFMPEYVPGYVCVHVYCVPVWTHACPNVCVCTCLDVSWCVCMCLGVVDVLTCPCMWVAWCTYVACLCVHLCMSRYVYVLMCMSLCLCVAAVSRVYVCDLGVCVSMCVFFVKGGDVWLGQALSVLFWIRQMKTSTPCFLSPGRESRAQRGGQGLRKDGEKPLRHAAGSRLPGAATQRVGWSHPALWEPQAGPASGWGFKRNGGSVRGGGVCPELPAFLDFTRIGAPGLHAEVSALKRLGYTSMFSLSLKKVLKMER